MNGIIQSFKDQNMKNYIDREDYENERDYYDALWGGIVLATRWYIVAFIALVAIACSAWWSSIIPLIVALVFAVSWLCTSHVVHSMCVKKHR